MPAVGLRQGIRHGKARRLWVCEERTAEIKAEIPRRTATPATAGTRIEHQVTAASTSRVEEDALHPIDPIQIRGTDVVVDRSRERGHGRVRKRTRLARGAHRERGNARDER